MVQYKLSEKGIDSVFQEWPKSNTNENKVTIEIDINLKKQLIRQILQKVFQSVNKQIENQRSFDVNLSGSTLVVTIITPSMIITANCGDSRGVIVSNNGDIIFETLDHKPERPEEQQRIEVQYKGRVKRQQDIIDKRLLQDIGQALADGPYRVWSRDVDMPGLAMSRSIGDLMAKGLGVIADPEIQIIDYNIDSKDKKSFAIALASDGIWDVIESKELAQIIAQQQTPINGKYCVNQLMKKSHSAWIDLPQNQNKLNNGNNGSSKYHLEIDDTSIILAIFNNMNL